jgi:hypothetical protein
MLSSNKKVIAVIGATGQQGPLNATIYSMRIRIENTTNTIQNKRQR